MQSAIRNVKSITSFERQCYESVLGRKLRDDEQVLLQVIAPSSDQKSVEPAVSVNGADVVPEWCNVLEGISDSDLADFNATLAEPIRFACPET